MAIQHFSDYLQQQIKEKKLKKMQLAKNAGLSTKGLQKILEPYSEHDIQIATVIKLALALDEHPTILFGYLFKGNNLQVQGDIGARQEHDSTCFLGENYPDKSHVKINETFTKIWEIQNSGNVLWKGRWLQCVDELLEINRNKTNHKLHVITKKIAIPETYPEDKIKISVTFTAPSTSGIALSYWKMLNAQGEYCFPQTEGLSCVVEVIKK